VAVNATLIWRKSLIFS